MPMIPASSGRMCSAWRCHRQSLHQATVHSTMSPNSTAFELPFYSCAEHVADLHLLVDRMMATYAVNEHVVATVIEMIDELRDDGDS